MKFATKLTAIFSVMLLAGSILITYFVYTASIKTLETEIGRNLEDQAFHTMDKIDRVLHEHYDDMESLAGDPVISSRRSTPAQITERLAGHKNIHSFYSSLAFFDLNRIRIADTSGNKIGQQHRMTNYWNSMLGGKDFDIGIYEDAATGKPTFHSAVLVKDKRGTPFGVLVAKVPVENLYDIVKQAAGRQGDEGSREIELVDKNGLILYSNYQPAEILKGVSVDWEPIKGLMTKGEKIGSVRHQHLGEEEITTFAREQGHRDFKGNDWTLIICVPTKVAFAPAIELRNKMIVIFLLPGLAIVLGIMYYANTLSRPIRRLSHAAKEIGRGNFDVRVDVRSGDEIGELAGSFNRMAQDLKESESELRRAKEEWERTFDAITEPIMILDVNHRIVKSNKAMADKLGVTTAEAQGLTCYKAVHGKKEPPDFCPHSKLLADGQVHTAEIYEERMGGYFIINVSPIYDSEGRLIGSIHTGLDITDRKEAEKALQESEEQYRGIFDHARDVIFTVGMDTLFTSLNPAFEKITGWPREKWLGNSFAPVLHPEDLPKALGLLQRIIQGETVDMFELRVLKKSGEYFIGEFTVAPIKQGETVIALGHVRDITERRLNEEKIRMLTEDLEMKVEERTGQLMKAQEELARKERLSMLGQLAGGVGHELRNPLGVISNAVYFLKTVLSDANETVKEYLNIIKDEVDNSQYIISDLLDLSRTRTPQTRAISVQEVVRPSLAKCVIPENVAVQIDLPETLPEVLADPLQMGQVFQNLITNALQAMPEGGGLQISARLSPDVGATRWVALEEQEKGRVGDSPLQKDNNFIEISVTDTGKGISPENIDMLFQPLFTTKARGIGLGLAISRRFAEANNGKLEIGSRQGKGATFTVTLPIADEAKKR